MPTAPGRSATFAIVFALGAVGATVYGDRAFRPGSALCAASAQVQETAATGVFHGVGVVKAIGATTGWLTLDHEDIEGFMPAMEMMYRAEPRELSATLHVGDRVAFDIDAGRYAIVGAKIIEPAK